MTRRVQTFAVCGLVAWASGLSLAGPLDRGQLPAGVRLVAHADFDAMRSSEVGRFLIEHPKLGPMPMLERLRHDVGVDPVRDVRGVTLYATSPCMAHTVAVLTCSGEGAAKFVERMAAGELPEFEHGGRPGMEYWSWRRREVRTFAAMHAGARADQRRIVFADSVEQLGEAVVQLDAPARVPDESQPGPGAGSCIFVWVQDFGDCEVWRPQAQVLRHTGSVVIDVGFSPPEEGSQAAERVYGAATVEADSQASAELMSHVLAGTLAMYQLGVQGEAGGEDTALVLKQVHSEVRGKALKVMWEPDVGRIMAALRAITEAEKAAEAAEASTGKPGELVSGGTP